MLIIFYASFSKFFFSFHFFSSFDFYDFLFLFDRDFFSFRKRTKSRKNKKSKKIKKKKKKKKKSKDTSDSESSSEDDPSESSSDDNDYSNDSNPLMCVGGKSALKIIKQGGDEVRDHPSWVHIPTQTLETQRGEIRNHIAVSFFSTKTLFYLFIFCFNYIFIPKVGF